MFKLLKTHLRFWVRLFWTTVLFAVILLAVLVQIGRTVFPVINEYRTTVESQLSLQLGVDLSIGEIEAVWQGLRPRVSLNDVSILNTLGEPVFEVGQIDIELSILKTLIHQSPSFRNLSFRQLEATLIQTQNQLWRVRGLPESTSLAKSKSEEFIIDDPLDIFLFGRRVQLIDTSLDFIFLDNLKATVVIPDIHLENDTSFHRLTASFAVDGEQQELNLVVEGLGDPRDESEFEASGFLTLKAFPVEKVFAALGVNRDALLPKGVTVDTHQWQDDSRVNLNLWFGRKAKTGLTWQGDIRVEGVPFIPREGMVWPNTLASGFSGAWLKEDGWQFGLTGLNLRWDDFSSPELNLNIFGRNKIESAGNPQPIQIALQSLNIKQWHDVANQAGFIPEPLRDILDNLGPQGVLKNIWVDLLDKERGYFALKSEVSDASIRAWLGVPAIENVNGYIETSAFDGHLSLVSSRGFSLNFPKIYQHPLTFNQAKGDVRWKVDMDKRRVGVSSGQVDLESDEVSAKGNFNLLLPFKSSPGIEPEMTLSIGVKKGVASLHKWVVPYSIPKKLNEWLDRSIQNGLLTDAGFIYRGSLMKDNKLSRVLQFGSSVQQAELKFDPHWPALVDASGVLLLDDDDFKVTDLRGRMMDTAITNGEVSLIKVDSPKKGSKGSILDKSDSGSESGQAIALKADVYGDSGRALALLKKTPIAHILGEELGSWNMQGKIRGSVDLVVPLDSHSDAAKQNIQLQIIDNELTIPSLNLDFKKITGPLSYTHYDGIRSIGLTAQLWEQPLIADITTIQEGDDASVNLEVVGRMDVGHLQLWSRRPELGFTQGVTSVDAHLHVPLKNDKSPIRLSATSALEGISIDLPPPFNKVSAATMPLNASIEIYQASKDLPYKGGGVKPKSLQKYWFSVGGEAEVLIVNENDELKGITVALGKKAESVQTGEINILGFSKNADVGLWSDSVLQYEHYVDQQTQTDVSDGLSNTGEENTVSIKMDVLVGALNLGSLSFSDVTVLGSQTSDAHIFKIASKDLGGVCTLFNDERPMLVDLDYLYLSSADEAVIPKALAVKGVDKEIVKVAEEDEGLASVDVSTLPAMDFKVKALHNGKLNFGRWSFKLRPINGGVIAYNLTAQVLGLHVEGKNNAGAEVIWLQSHSKNETFFSGLVSATDVGSVMEKWDMEKALTSEYAKFNTDVQWFGAPDEIALERLFGIIDVDMKHGRFIRGASAGENPFVKLIGLLNFDTLARRFRFDFSDLHPEGMSYDLVKGAFQFHRGMVKTQSPLLVDMPASNIQFMGDIDVINEQVDAKLVVTLPLAGISTTAVAALTGGVPLAVGVFVAGKIFKRQVDQASSIRYHVNGSWDDPRVGLEKVFENKVSQ